MPKAPSWFLTILATASAVFAGVATESIAATVSVYLALTAIWVIAVQATDTGKEPQ